MSVRCECDFKDSSAPPELDHSQTPCRNEAEDYSDQGLLVSPPDDYIEVDRPT